MKKLLTRLLAFWSVLRGYAHGLPVLAMALHKMEKLRSENAKLEEVLSGVEAQRDEYERELRLLQMEPDRVAEKLMQLRVHGMSRNGVIGYGVTAFIPNDVLEKLRTMNDRDQKEFTEVVADNLVYRALRGLWYRSQMNNVSALVFDWRPEHAGNVNAVYMESADKAPRIAARDPVTKKIAAVTLPEEKLALPAPKGIWQ